MSDEILDFGKLGGRARAIALSESPFDENGFPKPWVLAITVFGHLLLLFVLINIEPMIIKKDDVVYGVDIVQLPPPPKVETIPPVNQETLSTPQQPQTRDVLQPEPLPQTAPQIVPPEQVPEAVKKEIIPPEQVPPPILQQEVPQEKVQVNKVQINPQQIQTQTARQLKTSNFEKLEEPEELNLAPLPNLSVKTPQLNKLQSPSLDVKRPVNAQKLDAPNNIKTVNPNINRPVNDLRINVDEFNRNIDEKQKQADLARQKALEAQQLKQDAARLSANAPKANGGELAPPSGGSSGVTAIGGGGASGGGAAGGGGILPNMPKSYGSGRNVFEEHENGSLLAKMGRAADCASLNRERDEKCPNWEPLDGHLGGKIAPKVQPQYKAPPTHVDPLPVCPPGTPKSNFGLSCLPEKR